jgi:large subunit ribosomal protein L25
MICAIERDEKPNKVRKEGFIPGVVYGKGMGSKSVKLDPKELKRLLQEHARNAKVKVKIGNEVKECILKELQKDTLSGQILNVELQSIHSDDMIKLKVPVIFHGKDELAARQELLQEYAPEVEITGKANIMPEHVVVDVRERKAGEKITVKDIKVGDGIKLLNDENEIIAVITEIKEYTEENENA